MRRVPCLSFLLVWLGTTACGGDDGKASGTGGDTSGASESTEATTDEAETDEAETDEATDEAETDETDETETETGEPNCFEGKHAIVSDIDETLTTADSEFLMQLIDSTHDPAERTEASELINDYHQRGYTIVYLTARAESQASADDAMVPARQLTEEWLVAHGFPLDENTQLFLAPGFIFGDEAAMYKGQTLLDLQAEGYTFDYAYGNAVSDIDGYELANIPKDVTFIIGPEAGVDETVAIPEEGWDVHRAAHIPTVPNYCEG